MAAPVVDINETVERLWRLVRKHRWWIVGTASVVALTTAWVQSFLPNRYRSEATLVVLRQQVSTKYVEPSAMVSPNDAVINLMAEILSRRRLLGIVNEFGLYAKERAHLGPEEVADMMRADIDLDSVDAIPGRTDFSTFKIAFTGSTAELARDVTNRLTSLFIDGNSKARGREASTTTSFLTDQVANAKRLVAVQEGRLRAFKSQYLGELPEQQGSNLGVMTDLRLQLQNIDNSIARAQQQIQLLDQQKAALQASVTSTLTRLQTERTTLLSRFTARHPEVLAKDQEISRTSAQLERLKAGNLATDRSGASTPDEIAAVQLKTQMDAANAEIDSLNKQAARLRAEVDSFQRKLNLSPVRDQQLKEILRDYDLYNKDYSDLLNRQLQSQLTSTLEERQEGQQFRLADTPTFPSSPASPKRKRIIAGGLAGGLILGLLLAFLLDRKDTSFYSEKALKRAFPAPLVLAIPVLRTRGDIVRRRWMGALEWAAGTTLVVVVGAAGYYASRL